MQASTQGKQMTAHVRIKVEGKHRSGVFVVRNQKTGAVTKKATKSSGGAVFIPVEAMDESLEDARLNAIADERANGPFVSVSLDDL